MHLFLVSFPLPPSLLKTDTLPVHHLTAEEGDTLDTTKFRVNNSLNELNNFRIGRRVPSGGLNKEFKVQEWNHHESEIIEYCLNFTFSMTSCIVRKNLFR